MWYKNPYILRVCNRDILFATFCTGKGTLKKGPIWNTLHIAVEGEYNEIREKSKAGYGMDNFSVFLSEDDFDYGFVKDTLRQIILIAIERVKLIIYS